ncbi:late competence protein ComER [Aquibacillus koreensis]|uniref:Late competence protein ComER n=1 Tax=Aquibacillus koreensis TaxID=279446 RepID=A0A9X3WI86_9BACI|nr:late competence protein ComER [Aquibacillus koreensis]MCT2537627.1 late competence protein ComER [Aquibacillus koreensis]MDC3419073.1 late competence protein ComER [Aquibacillus koreensis]
MKWGVIGTGNMGEILIDSWMTSHVVKQEDLHITNRTINKAYAIQDRYPNVHVCETAEKVVKEADILYICVKPLEIHSLLTDLYPYLSEDQCIVSITSPFSVERLESLVPCQVARMIPSITNRAKSGVTLATFGSRITKEMEGYLLQSANLYSTPQLIEDNITRIASDIVSCGPAFFGYLAEQYILAATEETNVSKELASDLTEKMFIGFGKLLEDGHYSLPELIDKVCVKGGVTGEGIRAIDANLGELFHSLIEATHDKFKEDVEKISHQLLDK